MTNDEGAPPPFVLHLQRARKGRKFVGQPLGALKLDVVNGVVRPDDARVRDARRRYRNRAAFALKPLGGGRVGRR